MQLIHIDQILTGAMEAVEEAGARLRETVWGPVVKATASDSRNPGRDLNFSARPGRDANHVGNPPSSRTKECSFRLRIARGFREYFNS